MAATPDTFIIPPTDAAAPPQGSSSSGQPVKKKSGAGKWVILFIVVFLIITLPVAVFYISQQRQLTEQRSKAAGEYPCHFNGTGDYQTVNGCTGQCGPSITDKTICLSKKGTITGASCCNWVDANVPTATPTTIPETGGKDGTAYGCAYKTPVSGLGQCKECKTAPKDCDIYKYSCGNYCFKPDCGAKACEDSKASEATNTPTKTPTKTPTGEPTATPTGEPTATPTGEPTATPTGEPTGEPTATPTQGAANNDPAQCDASCETDDDCTSGLSCSSVNGVNRCRKAECPAESDCSCPVVADDQTNTEDTSGQDMPVSGGLNITGVLTVAGSVVLLLLGLLL